MAVSFDAVGPSSSGAISASSTTKTLGWTHTPIGTPSAVLVAVAVGLNSGNTAGTAGTCTYGGASMTHLALIDADNANAGYIELFGIAGPSAGAQAVAYTSTTSVTTVTLVGGSLGYTGTGTTNVTAFGTPVTNFGSGASGSIVITGASASNRVAAFFCSGTGSQSVTAGTQRYLANQDTNSAAGNSLGADIVSAAGSVTITGGWTSDWWGGVGVELLASAGGGTITGVGATVTVAGGVGSVTVTGGITGVGTPQNTHATTGSVTGTWGTGQSRTTGNLLVAVVSAAASTSVTALSTPSGWSKALEEGNSGTAHARCAVYTKTATGGDAAPAFTSTETGTAGGMDCMLFELNGANTTTPVDTSGVFASGSSTATLANATFTVTTSGNIAAAGEYAIAVFVQERAAGNLTFADSGTGWTKLLNGNGVSSVLQTAILAKRFPASGATLNDHGQFSTDTTAYGAAIVIAFKVSSTVNQVITGVGAAVTVTGGTGHFPNVTITGIGSSVTVAGGHGTVVVGLPYISGLSSSGSAGYFTDQLGHPRFMLLEQQWAVLWNGGRWGGTWQSDIDAYLAARASQGYTAWYGVAWSDIRVDSSFTAGRTWDGIYPFLVNGTAGPIVTGSETLALNSTFWARFDYFAAEALTYGITCFLNTGLSYDWTESGGVFENLSTTQAHSVGALLATRYTQAAYPNVFFFFSDDVTGGAQDAWFTQILAGIQSTGDTRSLISGEQVPETNCQIEFSGGTVYVPGGFEATNATYNWCYTYDPVYLGIEDSYKQTSPAPLPVVDGDGFYYGDNDSDSVNNVMRRKTWWALSSGARGINNTCGPSSAGGFWAWPTGSAAAMTSDPNGTWITGHIGTVVSFFTGLADWYKLKPDTSNALVTAGRGTRATSDGAGFHSYNFGDSDNYVTASYTSTGTLAVIYCKAAFSITIDQTKMASGYTASWVDPASCAVTSATPGSTYSSSGKGNNSAGSPDWVLVLQGSSTVNQTVTGVGAAVTVTGGAGSVTAVKNVAITGAGASVTVTGGAGSVTAVKNVAITGVGAAVTVAGGTGSVTAVKNVAIAGAGASVTLAGGIGSVTATKNVAITGTGASITVTGGAGSVTAVKNVAIAGTGAVVTVAGGIGSVANGVSQHITGAGAAVSVSTGAGLLHSGQAVSGSRATVTVIGGTGTVVTGGSQYVAGAGAGVTTVGGVGTTSVTSNSVVPGAGAAVSVTGGIGTVTVSTSQHISGIKASIAVACGIGTAQGAAGRLVHDFSGSTLSAPNTLGGTAVVNTLAGTLAVAVNTLGGIVTVIPNTLGGTATPVTLDGVLSVTSDTLSGTLTIAANTLGGTVSVVNTGFGGSATVNTLGGALSVTSDTLSGTLTVPPNTLGGTVTVPPNTLGGSFVTITFDGVLSVTSDTLSGTLGVAANSLSGTAVTDQMQEVDITLNEYNDVTISFQIKNNGSAMDITGMTVNALFKKTKGDLDSAGTTTTFSSAGGSPAITVNTPATGSCTLVIPHADVLAGAWSFYRIDVISSGVTTTAIYGIVTTTLL